MAPVALYPDPILGPLLVAATNPQEVLDAGNWLLENDKLEGKALDDAAKKVGFTAPMRGLMQSRDVVDMMCSELGWTTEVGQAYVNDQAGLLDAVQRLRAQAKDAGNLASSEQLKVDTVQQEGKEVITVSPPTPEVVYVPQYNPVTVYQPAPAAAPATTTVVQEEEGHSTGAMVATGLLSFGAGLLVANAFDDDDDDDWDNYYPNYGRPMPYYPPYPYRPAYGGGFYPGNGYHRPPGYNHGFNNNTVINVNNQNNNYWNRFDNKQVTNRRSSSSPITEAKRGNRPELAALNERAKQGPARTAPGVDNSWKGKSSYGGATQRDTRAGSSGPATRDTAQGAQRTPKVQGSYAGAKREPSATGRPATAGTGARATPNPSTDRGRATSSAERATSRPATTPTQQRAQPQQQRAQPQQQRAQPQRSTERSAVAGVNHGNADRAASQRGKQSMSSHGAARQSRGGGGGGRRG
jgi:hypothetical protein